MRMTAALSVLLTSRRMMVSFNFDPSLSLTLSTYSQILVIPLQPFHEYLPPPSLGIRMLPCTHIYHIPCIDDWLKRKKNCPMCRKSIEESEYTVISCTSQTANYGFLVIFLGRKFKNLFAQSLTLQFQSPAPPILRDQTALKNKRVKQC